MAAKALVANFDAEIARHPSLVSGGQGRQLQSDEASISSHAPMLRVTRISRRPVRERPKSSSALPAPGRAARTAGP